ncbi:TPA: hypothetical protein I9588_001597 [Clostridioides difficile]|nr:hypothetical protein [Clostridioides difficile]
MAVTKKKTIPFLFFTFHIVNIKRGNFILMTDARFNFTFHIVNIKLL